jgi:hypothetical protein
VTYRAGKGVLKASRKKGHEEDRRRHQGGEVLRKRTAFVVGALCILVVTVATSAASGSDEAASVEPGAGEGLASSELVELDAKRTATSETFRLPDGALETRIYQAPVHFLDAEGEWKPIDEALRPAEDAALSNGPNSFDVDLPSRMGGGPVRLSTKGEWVSYELRGAATAPVQAEDNVASYEVQGEGVTFELTSLPNGVKEDIEIASPSDPSSFSFDLKASPGVTAELMQDGSIQFRESDQTIAELPPPLMSDNAPGRPAISDDVHYELDSQGAGEWRLTIEASRNWLQEEDRSWPVGVDPTLTVPTPSLDCTFGYYPPVPTDWGACGQDGYQKLFAIRRPELSGPGEGLRSGFRFDLSAIPSGAYVADATLALYSPESWNTTGVEVRQATTPWTIDVEWDTYDSVNPWIEPGGDFASYGTEVLTSDRGSQEGWWLFSNDPHAEHLQNDLATLVRRWVSGQVPNRGLIVKLRDEVECGGGVACFSQGIIFHSSAALEASKRPYLSITYYPAASTEPPLLDALNRAEVPLSNGGKWSPLAWAGGTHKTGRDTSTGWGPYDAYSTINGAYWSPATFSDAGGGDAAAITMQTAPGAESRYVSLWLNMPNPATAKSGYQLRWTVNPNTTTYAVKLSKWSAGTETVLASNGAVSIAAGSTLMISDAGGSVRAWQGTGGNLTQILSATDAVYSSGYVGIEGSGNISRSQTFKAGSFSPKAPDTTISSGPSGVVASDVSFSFTASEAGTTFECSLDGATFSACTTPKNYQGLSEGPHTFQVRAVGSAGGADITPAERDFQAIEIGKAVFKVPLLDNLERQEVPLATGKWSKASWAGEIGGVWMASYHGYGSTGAQLASAYWNQKSFSDSAGAVLVAATVGTGATPSGERLALWLDMPSPGSARSGYEARFEGLDGSPGKYKVELGKWVGGTRTVLGSTASFSVPVGTTMALTDSGSRLTLWTGTTAFTSVLSVNDSSYSGGYAGLEVAGGAGTQYNFRAGNIDLQSPNTTITSGPLGAVGPNVSLSFTATEAATFECSMDGGVYSPCTSPKAYNALAEGAHTFKVRAADLVGNQDMTPAQRAFQVYPKPQAVTAPTPNINTTSTTLNGIVNPRGVATNYQFEYGTTTSYGSKVPATPASAGSGTSDVAVGQLVSGLQGGTVYHYRLTATSQGGTSVGEDRTFKVDLKSPAVDFASSQTGGTAPEYTLTVDAEDTGAASTGIQRFDVLLNGSVVATFPQSCPNGNCPATAKANWKHSFSHALNGNDHLTVLIVDQANNVASSSFDLPSEVVRATVYTGNPTAGGTQISEEWLQLHTHNGRFQDSTKTITRGSAACSEVSSEWCSFLRTKATGERFSEVSTPIDEPAAISEAGTLLLPSQPEFETISSGSTSSILQSWQVLPPAAGASYQKVASKNQASSPEGQAPQAAGEWAFWIDTVTQLPLKSSLTNGDDQSHTYYYSYASSKLEAGDQSPSFFLLDRPTPQEEGCLASGQLGGWSFNKAGFTYPDPRFNSVVNTATGSMILEPEGAAADGYDPRVMLAQDGVEVVTGASDEEELTWEFTETPEQTLEAAGTDTVVVTEAGVASAVILPSPAGAVEVVDGAPDPEENESGDTVVLAPTTAGTSADVQSIDPSKVKSLCVTQAMVDDAAVVHEKAVADGIVLVKPQASTTQTTQVKIWINPHPALAGVSVTDKYGTCSGPNPKTFGTNGYVTFGGCPIGKSVTFTVPQETSAGGITYKVPDPSRTISPPSYGWTIEFNYNAQAPPPPAPPPPPSEGFPELRLVWEWVEADGAEADASSEAPIPVPSSADCVARGTRPWRSESAIPNQYRARAKAAIRCRAGAYVVSWWANLYLSRWISPPAPKEPGEWKQRAKKSLEGPGPATTNQGPYFIGSECRHLDNLLDEPLKLWRTEGEMISISEYPNGATALSPLAAGQSGAKRLHCG